jgi:hypothetical protein
MTLTRREYDTRRAELEARIAEKQAAYEAAALARTTGQGDSKATYDVRQQLVGLELELTDLNAAWRASEREQELHKTDDGIRRRKEAYQAASAHLAKSAKLVAELETLALRMGDLIEEAVDEDQAARSAASPLMSQRDRETLPYRLVFEEHELWGVLEGVRDRFIGKQPAAPNMATRSAARAKVNRERIARFLGQAITDDNEQEAA